MTNLIKSITNKAGVVFNIGDTIMDNQKNEGVIFSIRSPEAGRYQEVITLVNSGWPLSGEDKREAEEVGLSTAGKEGWYQSLEPATTGPQTPTVIVKRRMPTLAEPVSINDFAKGDKVVVLDDRGTTCGRYFGLWGNADRFPNGSILTISSARGEFVTLDETGGRDAGGHYFKRFRIYDKKSWNTPVAAVEAAAPVVPPKAPAPVEHDDKLGRWFIMEDGMHKGWMNDYGVAEGSIGYVIAKAPQARSYRVGFPYVGEVIIHENFLKTRVNPFIAVGYPKGVIDKAVEKEVAKVRSKEFARGHASGIITGKSQERNSVAARQIVNALKPKPIPTTPVRPTAPMARAVLEMIEAKGTVSALEAGGVLKCRDLPKRISELRQLGWNIQRELKNDTRDGQRYARYYLLRTVVDEIEHMAA